MICISIAQDSRRFAVVDMHNAAPQCDLIELRLDRFDKSPDIGEMIAHSPKPIILSCRRQQDGGEWKGTEEERLAILRQCIISKANYVEIEMDVADQIRPFPGCKRVISYYNLEETPRDLADIYAECQHKKADVVKLVTLARTPEEAWPLVQILARPAVPTVAVGIGAPGIMLSVLGRKMEAPWVYAALERGMEAYPEQATVSDLQSVYDYQGITRATKFVGVTGFNPRCRATVALVNAAFRHVGQNTRSLPMGVGNARLFRKVLEAVKVSSSLIADEYRQAVAEVATYLQGAAQMTRVVDMIIYRVDGWYGYHLFARAALAVLESVLIARDYKIEGRTFLLVGTGAVVRVLGQRLREGGGILIVASRERDRAQTLAQELGCRHVAIEAIYTTFHDVLIVGGRLDGSVHPGYLRPGMVVADIAAELSGSELLREARQRDCAVVEPRQLLLQHVWRQLNLIIGSEIPLEVLQKTLDEVLPPDEE